MEEEVKKAKNSYLREWRSKNKDKVKKHNADYWKRRVEKMKGDN
jgi:hypothetical protein